MLCIFVFVLDSPLLELESSSTPLLAISPNEPTPLGDGSLIVPGVPHHTTPPDPYTPLEYEKPHLETTVPDTTVPVRRTTHSPEPVLYTSSSSSSSRSTTIGSAEGTVMQEVNAALDHLDLDIKGLEEEQPIGYKSPPPPDERASMMRDERRYRLHLDHHFHPSRKLLHNSSSIHDIDSLSCSHASIVGSIPRRARRRRISLKTFWFLRHAFQLSFSRSSHGRGSQGPAFVVWLWKSDDREPEAREKDHCSEGVSCHDRFSDLQESCFVSVSRYRTFTPFHSMTLLLFFPQGKMSPADIRFRCVQNTGRHTCARRRRCTNT